MDIQPPCVADRASGAQVDALPPAPTGDGADRRDTVATDAPFPHDTSREVPPIRLARDRIASPAPHRDLSPAEALDLVRRLPPSAGPEHEGRTP